MGILLASILVVCLLAAFFFPWESLEERIEGALNARLKPLRVDVGGFRLFLREGPGITIEELRVHGPGSGTDEDPVLLARSLLARPSIENLAAREVAVHVVVDALRIRSNRADGDPLGLAGIPDALVRWFGVCNAEQEGAKDHSWTESLSELIPLPGDLALTRAGLEIREGSLDAGPSSGVAGARASVRVETDLSFQAELMNGALQWNSEQGGPFRLSAIAGAEIRGRAICPNGGWLDGEFRLRETVLGWREGVAEISEPIGLTVRLEGKSDRILSVPQILLAGPGLEMGMAASTKWSDEGPGQIEISDLSAKVENWEPCNSLLFSETVLAGKLSLVAAKVDIEPARFTPPSLGKGSFRPAGPEGLSCEGIEIRVTDARMSRTQLGNTSVSLDGFEMSLEQKGRGWTGAANLADVHAIRGEAVRFSGPAMVNFDWSEEGAQGKAILSVDLSRGSLRCMSLLDKPPNVSLDLEARARFRPEDIRVDRASLRLGNMEWSIGGTVKGPEKPLLHARLEPNTISMESLAEVVPATRNLELGGLLEIKELALSARLRAIRESARLRARLAGKDLRLRGTSVRGLYAQAVYREQLLTVCPVVIQPATGMAEMVFSADFSETFLNAGLHRYYGTVRVDHVGIDELTGLVAPNLAGKIQGSADINLAFRGSGFSWPEAQADLEARARMRLNRPVIAEPDGPDGESGDTQTAWLESLINEIGAERPDLKKDDRIDPEQGGLLTENRAAGWFTLQEGRIQTDNLVAIHDGSLIEIQGSIDTAGHLQVQRGRIFTGGKRLPFRVDCMITEEGCGPTVDMEEIGTTAASELAAALDLLSEAAKGVYGDLRF